MDIYGGMQMNKKIDIYTLLGLVKDGKAPKKFKIDEYVYELSLNGAYYETDTENNFEEDFNILLMLNSEVEILDEEDEFIDIEEINELYSSEENDLEFKYVINDLIKNQKLIINTLKEEGK